MGPCCGSTPARGNTEKIPEQKSKVDFDKNKLESTINEANMRYKKM